jgi:hypothetical protein
MAQAFRTLLRNPEANLSLLSRRLTQVLVRTEEARLNSWKQLGLKAPPRPLTSRPSTRRPPRNLKQ